jgi:hypothetical protein
MSVNKSESSKRGGEEAKEVISESTVDWIGGEGSGVKKRRKKKERHQ